MAGILTGVSLAKSGARQSITSHINAASAPHLEAWHQPTVNAGPAARPRYRLVKCTLNHRGLFVAPGAETLIWPS